MAIKHQTLTSPRRCTPRELIDARRRKLALIAEHSELLRRDFELVQAMLASIAAPTTPLSPSQQNKSPTASSISSGQIINDADADDLLFAMSEIEQSDPPDRPHRAQRH